MFKVGDKVVTPDGRVLNYEYTLEDKAFVYDDLGFRCGFIDETSLRHATPEEIAAGHRIDKCKCVATRTYENGMCNKCGLHDMGDDSHIENHVSPLCKVGVK